MKIDFQVILAYGLVYIIGYVQSENEFCHRGFQVASKFHDCWGAATFDNKYPALYQKLQEYTPEFLQDYATHMCRVVKPKALECLQKEIKDCTNFEKLMSIANESGGACDGNDLNPYFKTHVIDHLKSVSGDSPCFNITDDSYGCYKTAGSIIMNSGVDTVDISKFYKVANKFFDIIWDCHINVFKSKSNECEQWQLPMLLALQRTAMPSLFGMRLNNYQVAKLELGDNVFFPTTTSPSQSNECEGKNGVYYILLKALLERPQAEEGNLVLQVNTGDMGQPVVSLVGSPDLANQDIANFVDQVSKQKEQKKKEKEIKTFIQKIGATQKKNKQERKGQQAKQIPKGKKTAGDGMID